MIRFLTLFFLCFLGCSPGCGGNQSQKDTEEPSPIHWTECGYEIGDHACDFSLLDQDGNIWNLYSHYGEVIVIDFSTEWCGVCHAAAQETQQTQDRISETVPFSYVTIMLEDMGGNSPPTPQAIQRWCEHYSITAPVLIGDRSLISEGGWPVSGFPYFFILNSDLVIVEIIPGWSSAYLDQAIQLAIDSQ